jgi:hypothetical protein
MKCKAIRREIEELEAGAQVSACADEHLLTCAACRAFARERASLRRLVGSLERVSAPADFDWKLRARLAEARTGSEQTRGWLWQGATTSQALALAASFVFLVVAVVIYQQTRPAARKQPGAVASTETEVNVKREERAAVAVNSNPVSKDEVKAIATESGSGEAVRPRPARNLKPGASRAESASPIQSQRIFSNDLGSRSAEEFSTALAQNSFTGAGPVISVPVRSNRTAPLQFEDGQGTRRTLSPVSFGGQELIERPDRARLVPASENGIW